MTTHSVDSTPRPHSLGGRLWKHWPVLLASALFVLTVWPSGWLQEPHLSFTLPLMAVIYVVWSLFRKELLGRQLVGLAVFTVVGVAGMLLLGTWVAYVVLAAGLLGHASWDFYHFKKNQTVDRWYAEACGVFDGLLGLSVLAALFFA